MVLLLTAFRMAWPAFAYSIQDDGEAKRTYAFVLTYLVVIASWLALGLGLLAPWLVRLLTQPQFYAGERVVAPLAFGGMAYAAYIVMAIGVGRAKRTQFNWVITGFAAVVNVALNLILIPAYGIMGAAVATVAAYVVMFLGMTWYAQLRLPGPVPVAARAHRRRGRAGAAPGGAPARGLRRRARPRRSPTRSRCCCSASSCPRSGAACWRGSAASRRAGR